MRSIFMLVFFCSFNTSLDKENSIKMRLLIRNFLSHCFYSIDPILHKFVLALDKITDLLAITMTLSQPINPPSWPGGENNHTGMERLGDLFLFSVRN